MPIASSVDQGIFAKRESSARSYCRAFDVIFTRGKGSFLYDGDGREFIDFLAGCSSLNYGHNDPDMKAALVEHITNDGVAHALDMHTDAKAAFLRAFQDVILRPRGLNYRLQFTGPTGANAVEAAMKLARKVTGRDTIVAFTNGFHGVTMGALAATGNGYHRRGGSAALNGVARLPYDGYMGDGVDTADLLEAMLQDNSSGLDAPAAILLETVQGEGGLNVASVDWLRRIAQLAKVHGALLIVDDIQAGCGRTGGFFSFERAGVEPDIVTMAKSLSGFGLPMALTLIKPEHDIWSPAEHNGTFRGNTHAFVTARVALEKFWANDELELDIARKGGIVRSGLAGIADMIDGARLKGRGMMRGVDVRSGDLARAICARAFDNGLIVETSGAEDQVVKILAPLTTPDAVLEDGLSILHQAAKIEAETVKLAAE